MDGTREPTQNPRGPFAVSDYVVGTRPGLCGTSDHVCLDVAAAPGAGDHGSECPLHWEVGVARTLQGPHLHHHPWRPLSLRGNSCP